MVSIYLISKINITTIGEDLEKIVIPIEFSVQELKSILDQGKMFSDNQEIVLDLSEGVFKGRDIINLEELIKSIHSDFQRMCRTYNLIDETKFETTINSDVD